MCPLFPLYVFFRFTFLLLTLFVCGNIHLNPGPKRNRSRYNSSICHWNLNSITAHNYEKINLLEAYNTDNKFDMICISESYLDSSISVEGNGVTWGRQYKIEKTTVIVTNFFILIKFQGLIQKNKNSKKNYFWE